MKPQQPTELTEWVDAHTDELFAWALYKVSDVELAKYQQCVIQCSSGKPFNLQFMGRKLLLRDLQLSAAWMCQGRL